MNRITRSSIALLAMGMAVLCQAPAQATQFTINFDVDANSNPIAAPGVFSSATRLTTTYSSLGVTFAGPGGNDGGAILNQSGNFGLNAHSGANFLAFNQLVAATMSDGGRPIGPETISFATPVNAVSVFGGDHIVTLRMQAYDSLNQLVATDTQTAADGSYVQMSVNGSDIRSVVLDRVSGNDFWVFDDLRFNTVPEPSSIALASLAIIGLAAAAWRKRRVKVDCVS